jgi:hypothetical protein
MDTLNAFAKFEYGVVDTYNMYAKKVESYQNQAPARTLSTMQAGV